MSTTPSPKLPLDKETLASLTPEETGHVVGGGICPPGTSNLTTAQNGRTRAE